MKRMVPNLANGFLEKHLKMIYHLTLFGENENSMLQTGTNSFGLSDNKLDDNNGAVILFKWDRKPCRFISYF